MADALPISGQIDPKAFPYLLMDLHRHGATGSLKVDGPSYQKALYYRGGRILFGSSNDPRDQLGSILIEEGKLTPEQLEDVNAKVGPGSPLAKVLADSGYVSQRELGEAARTKVERILSDVIAYETGSFEFEDGVLPKGAVDLKLSTERLVLAAVRRLDDRSFVLRHLGGLDVVLEPCAETDADAAEIQSETTVLLSQIDGRRTLKEAASISPLEEFETAKLACALLFLGIIQKSGGGVAAPTPVVAESDDLDLAGTARLAFGDSRAGRVAANPLADAVLPAPAAEAQPFFIPDSKELPQQQETVGFAFSNPASMVEPEPELDPTSFMAPPPDPDPPTIAPHLPPTIVGGPMSEPNRQARSSEPPPPPRPQAPNPAVRGALPLVPPPSRTPPPPSVPDIEVPPPPAASRPSKEDLAALDALLNSQPSEGPLTPLEKPSAVRLQQPWEPRFGPQSGGGRRPQTGSRVMPIALAAAGVVIVTAGAAGGWYWYSMRNKPAAKPPNVAAVRPTLSPTTLAAAPATDPAAGTGPSAAPITTAAAATPAPATPTTIFPASAPSPTAPPPKATSKPGTTAGGGSVAEARSLMSKGDLSQAAHPFANNLKTSTASYSVQLLVACSGDTVEKAVHNVQAQELFILPVNYKGRDCYRVCWGLYDSEAGASSAARSVPDYFMSGGAKPKVVPTSSILP